MYQMVQIQLNHTKHVVHQCGHYQACVTRITPIAKRNGKQFQLNYLVLVYLNDTTISTIETVRMPDSTPPTITGTVSLPPTANTAMTIPNKTA